MPSLETAWRYQKLTYWAANGVSDNGERLISSKVEIDVRWQLKQQQMIDEHGELFAVDGIAVVDRDIVRGSIVYLGESSEVSGTATHFEGLYEVVAKNQATDVKGRNTRRTIGFVQYHDRLPSTA
jgi:hypothetical protein